MNCCVLHCGRRVQHRASRDLHLLSRMSTSWQPEQSGIRSKQCGDHRKPTFSITAARIDAQPNRLGSKRAKIPTSRPGIAVHRRPCHRRDTTDGLNPSTNRSFLNTRRPELSHRQPMKHVQKHVHKLASGRAAGYGAAYTLPVFVTVAAISLWVNATRLQWLGLAHVVVLAKLVLLLAVHELLRPFCLSFGDVCALTAQVGSAANAAVLRFVRRGLRPKFPEWTIWYEWFQAIAFAAGQRHGGHILKMPNALAFRRNFELVGRLLGAVACWRHGHELRSFRYNGLEHLWLRSRAGQQETTEEEEEVTSHERRVVVLYFHGGGYALFSPRFFVEFSSRLLTQLQSQLRAAGGGVGEASARVDVQILLANYRKLPEVRFPAPLDDAMAMFDYLVSHEKVSPRNIVLAGDSAGGGLVLATLLRLRRAGREMPLAALCSCPYADLSADVAVSEHCFISKSMLDAIRDLCVQETPRASWREGAMLHTDLRGLPPLFVQAAEFDILHQQSLQLVKNARADGVRVELDVHEHMPHVFTLFPHFVMPQSTVGIQRFAAFITRQLTVHRIPVQLPGVAPAF